MLSKFLLVLFMQQFIICFANRIETSCVPTGWTSNGITVAGGNGLGNRVNQFNSSYGVAVDSHGTAFVTDFFNNRVIRWERNASTGSVWVEGQCGAIDQGQLCNPTAIALDQAGNLFVAAEYGTRGSVIMFRNGSTVGRTLILGNTSFYGIALDQKQEYLYVGHHREFRVVKYRLDGTPIGVVAGGHGEGDGLDQLDYPRGVAVDNDGSVFVSDSRNHRIMKWLVGSTKGIVVAGGNGNGSALDQLNIPGGLKLDEMGAIYVADEYNQRIIRFSSGSKQGVVIAGGNGRGNTPTQFDGPFSLTLDSQNNIYVSDWGNARIQLFTSNSSTCSGSVRNHLYGFNSQLTFIFCFLFSIISSSKTIKE